MHHNHKKNVLWWKQDPADDERPILRDAIRKLKAARDRRTAPFVDRTAYVNWNAMMAGAFLQAGAVLDRKQCNALAVTLLERIWNQAWDVAGGMSHALGRPEPRGMLDDNVQSAAAFLDAYEATGESAWLERASAVMNYCEAAHRDATPGYFDIATTSGVAYLAARAKPVQDAPTPTERRRRSGTGAPLGTDGQARVARAARSPAWRFRRQRRRVVAVWLDVAARHRLGGESRHQDRSLGPERRRTRLRDALAGPPDVSAAQSRGPEDRRSPGGNCVCWDELLAAGRDTRRAGEAGGGVS